MKKIRFWSLFLIMAIATACSSGNKSEGPDMAFAPYIKAYSGGMVSENGTIRVELNRPAAFDRQYDDVFSFSPSVKGSTRWVNPSVVEFVPSEGALKGGNSYRCRFGIGKVLALEDKKLQSFDFQVNVARKQAAISIDDLVIGPDGLAKIHGTVNLSESITSDKAATLLEAECGGASIGVRVNGEGRSLAFVTDGIERGDNDKELTLKIKNSASFVSRTATALIPARGDFRVLGATLKRGGDPKVEVVFSEPLSSNASLPGMIELRSIVRQQVEVKDNIAEISFEDNGADLFLAVSPSVRSADGSRLSGEWTTGFEPAQEKPAVEIPLQGGILPDRKNLILPLRAVNLAAVDVKIIQIFEDNILMFLQDNDLSGDSQIRRSGRLVYSKQFRLDGDPSLDLHKWNDFGLDLSKVFRREKGAIYRIRVTFKQEYSLYGKDNYTPGLTALSDGTPEDEEQDKWDNPTTYYWENFYDWSVYDWEDADNPDTPSYYMDSDRFPAVNLMASNLGIIAKYSGTGTLWVNVNDIISAKPVSGAILEVYDFQLRRIGHGKTGSDGMAELSTDRKPFVVVARSSDETGYLKLVDGEENSLSRFEVGGDVLSRGVKGFAYGERGVWRPGDTLHVTLMVADKALTLPQDHPAVMEVYCPEGQFYSRLVESGKDGFYTFHLPTSASDPTGWWNAYLKIGGTTVHKPLHIETIKPNRLKVQLDPGASVLQGGSRTIASVTSSWLTGLPASGLRAHAEMTLTPSSGSFKGFEGYTFRNPLSTFSESESSLFDTRLSSDGKASVNIALPPAKDAPGMLSAFIVTSVEEEGGDESFSTSTVPYSPFVSYVGIKVPEGEFLATDKDHTFSVAAVDPSGRRMTGRTVEYYVYKIDWGWWWENSSLSVYMQNHSPKLVASGKLTPGKSDATFILNIPKDDWGRYLVLASDTSSGHISGKLVTFDWPDYRGRADRRDPDAVNMLSFSTDKTSCKAGETVTVYIPAAKGGQALVSIENGAGVLSRKWVQTGEDETMYKVQVTPEMAPNFYIHITLVQPYVREDNDLPIRLYGVSRIAVEDPASHLEPVIKMADTVAPEEPFTVHVSEASGKTMTYTLAIVDEGLLDLTAFKTPDPWKAMYRTEALGVKTWDLYDSVIGAYGGRFSGMLGIGGDESNIRNARKDNRFNPVVAFYGPFTLKKGTASHKVTLPMYVGSVRVMVVAGHAPAYGSAEKTVTVKAPLMVLPTLPRTLAEGEKVTLPVNVFAMEDNVKNATVTIKTEGPLKIEGSDTEKVTFEKIEDKTVGFHLVATGTGEARVTVNATGSGHKAYETVTIDIQEANPETVEVTRKTIAPGKKAVMAAKGKASLEIAGFPSIDATGIYRQMKSYPYNCTEQLAAKGLVMLNLYPLLQEQDALEATDLVGGIIQEIYSRQAKDGGFVLWPGSKTSDSWVSSMVGVFLSNASAKGYNVSGTVMKGWSNYQKNLSKAFRLAGSAAFSDLDECYRLYSLAVAGDAQQGAMNRIKEAEGLSSRAAWMLADAFAVCGKPKIAEELIGTADDGFEPYSSPVTYGSALRDRAVALETLVLTGRMAEALPAANTIAEKFASGYWSTQEAAFASVAVGRLFEKTGNNPISATVGKERIQSPKSLYSMAFEGSNEIENTSGSDLYVTLIDLTRAPSGTPVPARASGLSVKVAYTNAAGATVNPASLRQGTEFTATVTVTNNSTSALSNIALSERIPSGWEIQNERLRGSSSQDASASYKDIRDDRCNWFFDLAQGASKRFTLKLRAAYEGEFVLPAITCEAMYDSAIAANTASGKAIVTK